MKKIKLTLKPSDQWLDYGFEEVEDLYKGIDEYEDLLVSVEDFESDLILNQKDLTSSFSTIFKDFKSNNIIYKWIQHILSRYKSYWIEHNINLNGSDYILFHYGVLFSIVNEEGVEIESFEKLLIDLTQDISSEEIIASTPKPNDDNVMPLNEIEKIKSILLAEEKSGRTINVNTIRKLFNSNGYSTIFRYQNRCGRFEIKVNKSYFALSTNTALESFLDTRNITIEFTIGYFSGHKIRGTW